MHENGSVVQTNVALQIPDAPGLMIPGGTYGRVSRVVGERVSLVHWEVSTYLLNTLAGNSSSFTEFNIFYPMKYKFL